MSGGDPASVSQLGGTLRLLATRLRSTGRAAHRAFDEPDAARVRGPLGAARSRFDQIDAAAATAAAEVDRLGSVLQAHATDLAEALAATRLLEARAAAAGLRLGDGTVSAAWGVTGLADAGATEERERARLGLQAELDAAAVVLERRRIRFTASLEMTRDAVREAATSLRTQVAQRPGSRRVPPPDPYP